MIKRVFVAVLVLFSLGVCQVRAADSNNDIASIEYFLAVDRLKYYSGLLAKQLKKQGRTEIAAQLNTLSAEDILKQKNSLQSLESIEKFDSILFEAIRSKYPDTKLEASDLRWDYNFIKKKLLLAFRVKPMKSDAESRSFIPVAYSQAPTSQTPTVKSGDEVLLDFEHYISEKVTRAVFWDAMSRELDLEFHVGTERDFRQHLAAEKAEVLAEIQPLARNYNKIYLVARGPERKLSYAFTRISGSDRLDHLTHQAALITLNGKTYAQTRSVKIYGSAQKSAKTQEVELTRILKELPRADVVIIGQKSAFESALVTALKAEQILRLVGQLDPSTQKAIGKLREKIKTSHFDAIKYAADVKKLHEKLLPEQSIPTTSDLQLEQPSHDIADYSLRTTEGRTTRIRLISNVWGDEVVPIANAIKAVEAKEVIYIGTAGGLPNRGLKVGSVLSPSEVITRSGQRVAIAEPKLISAQRGVLTQVGSPFQETRSWLNSLATDVSAVELEVGYLAETFKGSAQFEPYLLISDVVDSEDTLDSAAANANQRKKELLKIMTNFFSRLKAKSVVTFGPNINIQSGHIQEYQSRLRDLSPNRSEISIYQMASRAFRENVPFERLPDFVKQTKPFDMKDVQARLAQLQTGFNEIAKHSPSKEALQLYLPKSLEFGTWHPRDPLHLIAWVQDSSLSAEMQKLEIVKKLAASKIHLEIRTPADASPDGQWSIVEFRNEFGSQILDYYLDHAFRHGGMVSEVSRTGGVRLRFIPVLETTRFCRKLFTK